MKKVEIEIGRYNMICHFPDYPCYQRPINNSKKNGWLYLTKEQVRDAIFLPNKKIWHADP